MARRARERYGKPVDDFDTIDLEALFRFHAYVEDTKVNPVPLSFRAFVQKADGKNGEHRLMIDAVDGLEAKAEQLMMIRAKLDEENRKTGEYTDSFEEVRLMDARDQKSKREPGAITSYGHAWSALGGYLHELVQLMIEAGDDPSFLLKVVEDQHAELKNRAYLFEKARKRSAE